MNPHGIGQRGNERNTCGAVRLRKASHRKAGNSSTVITPNITSKNPLLIRSNSRRTDDAFRSYVAALTASLGMALVFASPVADTTIAREAQEALERVATVDGPGRDLDSTGRHRDISRRPWARGNRAGSSAFCGSGVPDCFGNQDVHGGDGGEARRAWPTIAG